MDPITTIKEMVTDEDNELSKDTIDSALKFLELLSNRSPPPKVSRITAGYGRLEMMLEDQYLLVHIGPGDVVEIRNWKTHKNYSVKDLLVLLRNESEDDESEDDESEDDESEDDESEDDDRSHCDQHSYYDEECLACYYEENP